LNKKTNNE